jgi:hypothetical protein
MPPFSARYMAMNSTPSECALELNQNIVDWVYFEMLAFLSGGRGEQKTVRSVCKECEGVIEGVNVKIEE